MKIIVDTLGGDFSPDETVKGAILASKELKETTLVLVGNKKRNEEIIKAQKADLSSFELVEAPDVVLNNESPVAAMKAKPNSSIIKSCVLLAENDEIDALVTTGATGAALTGSIFKIGRIEGVLRPALVATLPTKNNGLVRVLDIGANMDCKPEYLVQFAFMATQYLKVLGIENPRIGLLNVGKEDGKGNALTKETNGLLKQTNLNYIGNVEGDDVLNGVCDALICDGFYGNVFIKTLEGTAKFVSNAFKQAMTKNALTKFGSLFQLQEMKKVKGLFEYAKNCSAPLLGIKKLVIKTHGKAKADTVRRAILEAQKLTEGDLVAKITKSLQDCNK